ncbi:hypothetical protein GOB57_08345 [Sinorhizobium meliloti]|nr:hypothetical protein [Sinorhizobium meliloti]
MSKIIPEASVAYFRSVAGGRPFGPADFTNEFVRDAEFLRESIRAGEGGGGMCHVVSEVMEEKHGWPRLSVAYLSAQGDVICAAHVVSLLPDGSVIDWTRDQFGEGHSVSLISADNEEIGRYRPEFYEDFHPGHPDDTAGQLAPWLEGYAGQGDSEEQDRLRAERGHGWWLEDLSALDEYHASQVAYAAGAATPSRAPGF